MEITAPRAATGILEELTPVAAFTTPFGLILGVDAWADRILAEHRKNTDSNGHEKNRFVAVVRRRWLPLGHKRGLRVSNRIKEYPVLKA